MAKIVSDDGDAMIVIDSVRADSQQIRLQGRLLGTMYAEMFINPQEFANILRMLMNPSVILFTLKLPFILLFARSKEKSEVD